VLESQSILVTGASRGIGAASAIALAAQGAKVILSDLLDCGDTCAEILAAGGNAVEHPCDVADVGSVEALFSSAPIRNNGIDQLVHCAGIMHEKALLDTTIEEFDRVIAINLRGSFLLGQAALRVMQGRGKGRLTMIASDLAYCGRETFSAYVASKHAVLGLVRSWSKEFAPAINVNAICPGPIDTAMLDAANMSESWRQKELAIPLARFGQPEEVARLVVFVAGPGGDYITGQGLGINGGSVMP